MTPTPYFDAGVWWCRSGDLAVCAATKEEARELWERCQEIKEQQ